MTRTTAWACVPPGRGVTVTVPPDAAKLRIWITAFALLAFRGLDSGVRNVPFTSGGKIAFIDTERWDEQSEKKVWLRRIREYLSDEQRHFADAIRKAAR